MNSRLINIAYVEDQDFFRMGVKEFLQNHPRIKIVFDTENGFKLLEFLDQAVLLPEICVIDINMPYMDGFQLQQELSSRWPQIKTLAFSVHKDELFVKRMFSLGANGYLLKENKNDELAKAILEIHRQGFYTSNSNDLEMLLSVKRNPIRLPKLTEKEQEYLKLIHAEMTHKQIALLKNTTERSVNGVRDRLLQKLGVKTRTGLILYAVKYGLIKIEKTEDFPFLNSDKL